MGFRFAPDPLIGLAEKDSVSETCDSKKNIFSNVVCRSFLGFLVSPSGEQITPQRLM